MSKLWKFGGFTTAGYRRLLSTLMDAGYIGCNYDDVEPGKHHMILRHDLDMSLEAALPIAEIEAAYGLRATYFVLVRSRMYNLYAKHAEQALNRLLAFGHEIGLHLDAGLYGNDMAAINAGAERECLALETVLGREVKFISFHRPSQTMLGMERRLAGRRHAYEPRFFSEIGYCSDSRGAWCHGYPLELAAVKEGRAFQLLTHPIWWTRSELTPPEKLAGFLRQACDALDTEIERNCSVHKGIAPGTEG